MPDHVAVRTHQALPCRCADVFSIGELSERKEFAGVTLHSYEEWRNDQASCRADLPYLLPGRLERADQIDEPGWWDYVLPEEYGDVDADAVLLVVSEITGVSPDAITLKARS